MLVYGLIAHGLLSGRMTPDQKFAGRARSYSQLLYQQRRNGKFDQNSSVGVANWGIRVNAIAPGATIIPINESWIADLEKKAIVESHIPMGRTGTADEIAAAVAFLASDESTYITGQPPGRVSLQ